MGCRQRPCGELLLHGVRGDVQQLDISVFIITLGGSKVVQETTVVKPRHTHWDALCNEAKDGKA